MKVKALKSFVGKISMNIDDIKEVEDTDLVRNLIKDKFVEVVKENKEVTEEKPTIVKSKKYKRK